MASMQDGVNFTAPPYGKVLLLGAIAAASAFVVTILIVVLCVGCQRKGKTHSGSGEGGKHRLMDMSILRQSKLRSISKSDTKLHEMNKLNCNGKKASKKNRPASMDLLLLPSRRSNSDRQLPQIPPGTVGGRAGETDTPAPPAVPANTPAPPDPDGDGVDGGMPDPENVQQVMGPPGPPETAEYACIRKVRKVDKAAQKRDNGTETDEGLVQQRHSSGDVRHGPPSHPAPPPPHPHSQKMPRKNMDAFNLPTFPKEAVFMGNGEEYIWKPPDDEDFMIQHKQIGPGPLGESIQPSVAGIADMYSKVCKPSKKKRAMPGSPPGNTGYRTLGRGDRDRDRDGGFSVVVKPQTWAPQEAKGARAPPGSMEDHCYEAIGSEECDPAYEAIEGGGAGAGAGAGAWKRERPPPLPNASATLRPKKKKPQQPLQQPPPPPPQQTPKLQHLPAKSLLLPGENLYESIGDLKHSSATSSTTTIFTFNDGMEMYVTGL
ncbi:hypothetical protein AALO_G00051480 [Alosa alosa]|uniref:Uncharacterized protein n=1 Tax=Alosa alosa TaxID=278164 RepID=A0AAV6H4G6_9TELE|nr:collagen alpha-1(III) chain isoform X1 [Alosa sapidissima]XP_048097606.1 collagen alpha-1(III) chain isoform X1 [Alosa alosa]KAG5282030.1 hypothetical protein AALO_G00051480 [Alosa alosa]